jgi:hypothetical protein
VDNKEAMLYEPKSILEKSVSEAHSEVCRRSLNFSELNSFIEGIVSYDGLFEIFLNNPYAVSKDIFSTKITGHVCIPCYTVELRQILKSRTSISNYPNVAVSLETAKKYFSEYPVLLVVDDRKILDQSKIQLDGVHVYDNEFRFGEALVRVLVRDRGDSDTMAAVSRIVRDVAPGVDFGVLTDAPGIDNKMAQALPVRPHLKKYIVNVPTTLYTLLTTR